MNPGEIWRRRDLPGQHVLVLSSVHHVRHGGGRVLAMHFSPGHGGPVNTLGFLGPVEPEGFVALELVFTLPKSALVDRIGAVPPTVLDQARRVLAAMITD